jgi:hypothetical protein
MDDHRILFRQTDRPPLVLQVRAPRWAAGAWEIDLRVSLPDPYRAGADQCVPDEGAAGDPDGRAGPAPALRIETLGVCRIRDSDRDLTHSLLRRPVERFLMLYLLAREARARGDRITRYALGEELFPGIEPSRRGARLRHHLSLLPRLSPALDARLRRTGAYIWLDLSGADFDVRRLLDLRSRMDGCSRPPAESMERELEAALPLARREFLPGWEDVEDCLTGARGVAGGVVNAVRVEVEAACSAILTALADASLARYEPGPAIRLLKDALHRAPDPGEVAPKLADAYEQAGRYTHAARLRDEYGVR